MVPICPSVLQTCCTTFLGTFNNIPKHAHQCYKIVVQNFLVNIQQHTLKVSSSFLPCCKLSWCCFIVLVQIVIAWWKNEMEIWNIHFWCMSVLHNRCTKFLGTCSTTFFPRGFPSCHLSYYYCMSYTTNYWFGKDWIETWDAHFSCFCVLQSCCIKSHLLETLVLFTESVSFLW